VKGYDLLIQSFSKISSSYPNLKLFIAGNDDGEKDNLRKQIKTLNLDGRIKFVGNLKDKNKNHFLKYAKCVAVPSHTENFGIVVVEALAQGTPVIASKNTPWKELNEYQAGIYTENTVESIFDSIKIILSNIDFYKKNTIQLAEKYDWKVLAKKYQVILNEIYNG
jgi:glycosyltransferase involved in cell wall biosynthesis